VVLVGPGDVSPFDLLWQSSQTELYATLYPLTYTHRDMFFSAAVLDLVSYLVSTGELEIVHIHSYSLSSHCTFSPFSYTPFLAALPRPSFPVNVPHLFFATITKKRKK